MSDSTVAGTRKSLMIVSAIVLSCITALVVLVCVELAARVVICTQKGSARYMLYGFNNTTLKKQFRKVVLPDDTFYYRGIPDASKKDPVNSLGFRGPDVRPPSCDVVRIVCLGASTTYGADLAYHHTYPYLLQKALDRRMGEGRYEVINAGQPGLNLSQIFLLAQHDIIKLKPDIVFIMSINNNFEAPGFWFLDTGEAMTPDKKQTGKDSPPPGRKLRRFVMRTLVLAHFIDSMLPQGINRYFFQFDWGGFSRELMVSGAVWEKEYVHTLRALVKLFIHEKPATSIFLLEQPFNVFKCPEMDQPFKKARNILRTVSMEYDTVYSVDLAQPFLEAMQRGVHVWEPGSPDPLHWGLEGNRLIADILCERIAAAQTPAGSITSRDDVRTGKNLRL